MQYKLNKTIKEAIIKAALRHKYQEELNDLQEEVVEVLYKAARKACKQDYIESLALPDEVKRVMKKANRVYTGDSCNFIYMPNARKYLNVKDTRFRIYFGDDRLVYNDSSKVEYSQINKYASVKALEKKIRDFVKKVEDDLEKITVAVYSFSNAKKMFDEMSWTKDLYPDEFKPVGGQLVPVAVIEQANELMKV